MDQRRPVRTKLLVVPLVLAVTTLGAVVAAASSASGCGDNGKPSVDASTGDTPADTPIV